MIEIRMGNRIPERKARHMHIGRYDNDFKILPIKQTQRTANDAPTGTERHAKTAHEHANNDATMTQSRHTHTTPEFF
jgi:hypothetical protein